MIKTAGILFVLLVISEIVRAQGVESPPVTSFKPDTLLPKVNVPEFVITGKSQIDAARHNKQSTDIDSSYFQGKALAGLDLDIPINQSLSIQSSELQPADLFVRLSTGSYSTDSYLLSGSGTIGNARLNGSLSGNYTSGFTDQTIQRDISIQAGIGKPMEFDENVSANNSAEVGYSRGSYFLYGTGIPDLLRTMNQINLGVRSDLNFGNFPLTAGLSFNSFSLRDDWKDTQSSVGFNLNTIFQLPSGSINLEGLLHFGNHSTSVPSYLSTLMSPIDRSFYDLTFGTGYSNHAGDFSYSIGLNYFQYSDDSVSGVAKLYPDLRGTFRVSDEVSLFARYFGDIANSTLSTLFAKDRYVNAGFPLRNTQNYANFTAGANWIVTSEFSVEPQFNIDASRVYPIFASFPATSIGADTIRAGDQLMYASKATIYTVSISAKYKKDRFGADITLNSRSGTADTLGSIPNLAPFDLAIGADYRINPQFNFRASIFMLSDRYSDLALKNRLGSAWLLNFHLTYDLNVGQFPVEIFADGKNVLDQKYYIWQGYQEFPLGLFIGISSKIL